MVTMPDFGVLINTKSLGAAIQYNRFINDHKKAIGPANSSAVKTEASGVIKERLASLKDFARIEESLRDISKYMAGDTFRGFLGCFKGESVEYINELTKCFAKISNNAPDASVFDKAYELLAFYKSAKARHASGKDDDDLREFANTNSIEMLNIVADSAELTKNSSAVEDIVDTLRYFIDFECGLKGEFGDFSVAFDTREGYTGMLSRELPYNLKSVIKNVSDNPNAVARFARFFVNYLENKTTMNDLSKFVCNKSELNDLQDELVDRTEKLGLLKDVRDKKSKRIGSELEAEIRDINKKIHTLVKTDDGVLQMLYHYDFKHMPKELASIAEARGGKMLEEVIDLMEGPYKGRNGHTVSGFLGNFNYDSDESFEKAINIAKNNSNDPEKAEKLLFEFTRPFLH